LDRYNGRSVIDQDKCIKCGRCVDVCAYHAIIKQERPCAAACGMNAIHSDVNGKADIDYEKCLLRDVPGELPLRRHRRQVPDFQVIRPFSRGAGLCRGSPPPLWASSGKVTPGKLRAAMKQLGFADIFEVAIGADLCATQEAEDFIREVPESLPFMATSCCPAGRSWPKSSSPTTPGAYPWP
jgi:ferredoxin